MALPPRHPDPLSVADYLKELKGALDGLYVLGSFNRYITVHSQQIRAVNLIHALVELSGNLAGRKIAVIGGGFAGVTAAAYALEKTNASVTVFESASRVMWLQEHCHERWLHPGIYDWPLPGSLEPRTYLPVMNWTTGPAHRVVAQLREQWNEVVSRKANLTCLFETRVTAVAPTANGRLSLSTEGVAGPFEFDIVIVAAGFGLEDQGLEQPSYWNDIDGLVGTSGSVLISGFGDGALADLLRLCLPSYRQDRLIELVRGVEEDTSATIVEKERTLFRNANELEKFYQELEVDSVIDLLSAEPADPPEIAIAGAGALYGTTSAILNRFLVSQLVRARPGAFSVLRSRTTQVTRQNGKWQVSLAGGPDRVFDRAIRRHGPRTAIDGIAGVLDPATASERRQKWRSIPQALDQTRVPLFERPRTVDDLGEHFRTLSSYESSGDPWCLVIAPEGSEHWPGLGTNVLSRIARPLDGEGVPMQIAAEPMYVTAEKAVSDDASYRATVRALCTADVLMADVGDFDNPAVMLLLGIRAAVRRGVTVICTRSAMTEDVWRRVPFNIREIKPISLSEPEKRVRDLADAIRDGLGQMGQQSAYLDLPVYDSVRKFVPDESAGKTPVLYLRSFSERYRTHNLAGVRQHLQHALSGKFPGCRLYSVIDEASPRLAGQRLYSAIRHRELCVIDWTEWRANVFFEMGARLASHRRVPLCIIDAMPGPVDAQQNLYKLLSPFVYDDAGKFTKFKAAVDAYLKKRDSLRNHAFEVSTQFFDARQEGYATRVDESLAALASATVNGRDPLETVEVNVLYANDNPGLTRQVVASSFEQLCAAWCYLDEREAPHLWATWALFDPLNYATFVRYRNLGLRLRLALDTRHDDRDRRLLHRIRDRQLATRHMRRLVSNINHWRQFREQVEWGLNDLSRDELQDTMDRLTALKLDVDHGGRASFILQQGLAHDLQALEQALAVNGAAGARARPRPQRSEGIDTQILQDITALRLEAKSIRRDAKNEPDLKNRAGLVEDAASALKDAISMLKRALRVAAREPLSASKRGQLRELLSSTIGSLGGTYREVKDYDRAIQAYADGNVFEEMRRREDGHLDSYNLVQHLVVRLLKKPELLADEEFATELTRADRELDRQYGLGRRDSWFLSDVILIRVLRGEPEDKIVTDLKSKEADKSFYESTDQVLGALLDEGLGKGGSLEEKLLRFRDMLRREGGLKAT